MHLGSTSIPKHTSMKECCPFEYEKVMEASGWRKTKKHKYKEINNVGLWQGQHRLICLKQWKRAVSSKAEDAEVSQRLQVVQKNQAESDRLPCHPTPPNSKRITPHVMDKHSKHCIQQKMMSLSWKKKSENNGIRSFKIPIWEFR